MIRVLVCGGRTYSNVRKLSEVLNNVHQTQIITTIIHGNAWGADRLAQEWGGLKKIQVLSFPANWNKYGNTAGLIRNQEMLDQGKPDLVIAFPGGKGTKDMIERARKAGIEVFEVGE